MPESARLTEGGERMNLKEVKCLSIGQIDSALFKKGLPLPSASDPGSDVVFETLMVSGSLDSFLSFGSEEIFTCVIKQIKKHCYHL